MNPYMKSEEEDFHHLCRQNQLSLVHLETQDGQLFDGIIDEVDDQSVVLIMPWGDMEQNRFDDGHPSHHGPHHGHGYGPGYGGPGYGPGYDRPGRYPRRFRRFRRHRFPFRFLNRIFFPFFY